MRCPRRVEGVRLGCRGRGLEWRIDDGDEADKVVVLMNFGVMRGRVDMRR